MELPSAFQLPTTRSSGVGLDIKARTKLWSKLGLLGWKQWKTPIAMPLNEKYQPYPYRFGCTCPQFVNQLLSHLQVSRIIFSFRPYDLFPTTYEKPNCAILDSDSSLADSNWRGTGEACNRADTPCPEWDTRGLQGNRWWRWWESRRSRWEREWWVFCYSAVLLERSNVSKQAPKRSQRLGKVRLVI